uniref:Uncharacterized protein n=1 Tax=Anguilla anguilla TaxID=7936 RepID=A0A0E9TRX8_ANGAN
MYGFLCFLSMYAMLEPVSCPVSSIERSEIAHLHETE